jgi:hypothetical protein
MLIRKSKAFRAHARSMFRRIFHWLRDRLGIRRFRGHSFFGVLLSQPAVVADFGAHRGEFFAALRAEYSISGALLIEANPALAERLKETFGNDTHVLHAALVGGNNQSAVTFTRSIEPESSSIFREWAAAPAFSWVNSHLMRLTPNRSSQPLAAAMRRFDFMDQLSMLRKLAPASGSWALSR